MKAHLMSRRFTPIHLAAIAAVISVGLVLIGCAKPDGNGQASSKTTLGVPSGPSAEPSGFAGYVRTPPLNVSDVTLPRVDGTPINMVAPQGGLRLVYFGFMTCPDVCPMTLSNVKVALADLTPADRARVQVDVITVDPSRDSGERFVEYVSQFVPNGNAIRTDDPYLLRSAAKTFGADYRISLDASGEKQVSHTDDLYVIDDTGTIVLAWPFGTPGVDVSRDLGRLLAGNRPSDESTERNGEK